MAEAKKTKKPVEAAQEAAKAKSAEKKVRESNEVWKFNPESKRTDEQKQKKLAPQAQAIVKTVEAAEGKSMKRSELIADLAKTGVLKTRQPEGRIVAYYKKALIEAGAIVIA